MFANAFPGRYWEMVERLKVNQIYLAPTALRLLLKFDDHYVTKYDRSTLKTLGCGKSKLPRNLKFECPCLDIIHINIYTFIGNFNNLLLCSWRTFKPRGLGVVL